MKALCIDCLLIVQTHKNHEVLNIEKSLEKEDMRFKAIEEKFNSIIGRISKESILITQFKEEILRFAETQTQFIHKFYEAIRAIVDKKQKEAIEKINSIVSNQNKWVIEKESKL